MQYVELQRRRKGVAPAGVPLQTRCQIAGIWLGGEVSETTKEVVKGREGEGGVVGRDGGAGREVGGGVGWWTAEERLVLNF
jgi:hypothetical protein